MQTSPNRATRTFMDYDSITQAMDGNNTSSVLLLVFLTYIFFLVCSCLFYLLLTSLYIEDSSGLACFSYFLCNFINRK